ncbi:MAG: hypothetical protein KDB48_05715 [Solirubrobacterales bacterium]|nr:hypothetical protein [Solirubrobacterales bacterium]HMT05471.1 hypothetical protein [Solirubrobacterales bacterium]
MTSPGSEHHQTGTKVPAIGSRRARSLAITALLIAALWIIVVPALNRTLEYDDPIKTGEQLVLAPGITFVPPPGWNLESGLRASDHTRTKAQGAPAALALGPITADVNASPAESNETPQDLIGEIERTSVQFESETLNATGQKLTLPVEGWKTPGLAEHYVAPSSEGVLAAFVIDGTNVVVKVVGPAAQMDDQDEAIGEMLASFAYEPAGSGKQKAAK